uniref:SLTX n=1 Tax=Hemiscolopendra marginata TaxID=943146 RepID=A0A646QGB9_9MYRI
MSPVSPIILFGTVVILALVSSSNALKCIICDSPTTSYDCKSTFPEASNCPANLANYCFKKETFDSKGSMVMSRRGCTAIAAPSTACQESNNVKTCDYTCNSDGCNSVAGLQANHAAYLIASICILLYSILRE